MNSSRQTLNDDALPWAPPRVGVPVERPRIVETTGLGAAFLAGLGTGVWASTEELHQTWALDKRFEPHGDRSGPDAAHRRWRDAVERAKGWAHQG